MYDALLYGVGYSTNPHPRSKPGTASMDKTSEPSLDRLIKLLKMTTATVDGESLAAIRMANRELAKLGGDWEALLRGKVTIMQDPFQSIPSAPPPRDTPRRAPPPAPPRPNMASSPRPSTFSCTICMATFPQSQRFRYKNQPLCQPCYQTVTAKPKVKDYLGENKYPGHCIGCNIRVDTARGSLFSLDTGAFGVQCTSCYPKTSTVKMTRNQPKVNPKDLFSQLNKGTSTP